jgi:hypothetical protein
MPTMNEMRELVTAHTNLDEPMTAAIWIRQQEDAAWLVEVLPELPQDGEPLRPMIFTASNDFRYPLKLIAGNLESLKGALPSDLDIARAIVNGEVLHNSDDAVALVAAARSALGE